LRILADENVEQPVVARLRADGHTVEYVVDEPLTRGSPDIPILQRATRDDILLVTGDLDFGAYIYRDHEPAPSAGVVQYRLNPDMPVERKAEIVSAVFGVYGGPFLPISSQLSKRANYASALSRKQSSLQLA